MTSTKQEYIEKVNPYVKEGEIEETPAGIMKLSQDDINLMRQMIHASIESGKDGNNKYFVQKVQQFRDRFEECVIDEEEQNDTD